MSSKGKSDVHLHLTTSRKRYSPPPAVTGHTTGIKHPSDSEGEASAFRTHEPEKPSLILVTKSYHQLKEQTEEEAS